LVHLSLIKRTLQTRSVLTFLSMCLRVVSATLVLPLPVVNDIKLVDEHNHFMQEIGYEPKGENGITGRRFFLKGGDNRTHHVHIFQAGSSEIERHLAFRDYLREHPKAVQEYGQLKQQLAQQFPYDIESYINGKNHLVLEIERKALEWKDSRNHKVTE
jgi:GrpB-like predicted nucleotidyltransferase (UPF0157 family)